MKLLYFPGPSKRPFIVTTLARIESEINTPRRDVAGLFERQPYLTRFTSSMSADEMTEDPGFAFNPDLGDVTNRHEATGIVHQCDANGYYDYRNVKVRTASGLFIDYQDGAPEGMIVRDRGMTVRQGAEPGARVIERLPLTGPAIIEQDRSAEIAARNLNDGTGGAGGGGSGGEPAGGGGSANSGGEPGDGPDFGTGGTGGTPNGVLSADAGGDSGCGCHLAGRGADPVALGGVLGLFGLGLRLGRRQRRS